MNAETPFVLPADLPAPVDDGAASHLPGQLLPSLGLPATSGEDVDLAALTGRWVLYVFPMMARPGRPLPEDWLHIPGAAGCTLESCGFREQSGALSAQGVQVLGISAQGTPDQLEARERLHLPYGLLSDAGLQLKRLLHLPTFRAGGLELYKRLTLVVCDGRIEKVFYPVFPPQHHASAVVEWLKARP